MTLIKICGLRTQKDIETVITSGADFAGFVHCAASPRHLELDEIARLVAHAKGRIQTVVLLVNPNDALIEEIITKSNPDYLQLHGQETPQRVAEIQAKFNIKIIKAIGISGHDDLATIPQYAMAEMLLLDAKPPKDTAQTGGHGVAFDWNLIANLQFEKSYLLAGGLTSGNVAEALRITHASGVDVSSGVEESPGIKSTVKIQRFIDAARNEKTN